jgi:hypothetical protein
MTITEEEREEAIRQYKSDIGRRLGKVRSKKKSAASRRNLKLALEARWGKKRSDSKKRKS